tara:strand:+ start:161 stop:1657 length:1497 start_codon:yes stop_codon:yes gene_type:complete
MAIIKIKNQAIDLDAAEIPNLPATKITSGNLDNARLPNNISDGGTTGTKVASGSTAQRGTSAGEWRYNSTTGFFEGRNTDGTFTTLVPEPTISSVDDTEIDSGGGGNQTLVITGTNFASGGVISFIGNDSTTFNATSTTFNSATQVTAVAPKSSFANSKEPYDIKYVGPDSKTAILADVINVDNAPSWSTASGSVGNVLESTTISTIQLSATDPDGDAVTYSETTSTLSGIGLSLSSSGAITGSVGAVSGNTTTAFTVRATSGTKTTDRNFTITIANITTSALLWDANNLNGQNTTMPSSNGNGLGGLSPQTAVTLTNVQGASGTMASGHYLKTRSDTWSHYTYNDGRDSTIGDTFWSTTLNAGHSQSRYSNWFGSHNGGSQGNTDMWFTMDYGANPSFRIRRLTGYTEWRTGSANMDFYGTNDISNLNGNAGGSDAGSMITTGLTILNANQNIMSQSWDTGYFNNNTFYRYYVLRVTVGGGSYDWGIQRMAYYGDYY